MAALDPLRALVTLALAISLWFGLRRCRWCKNRDARTKLAAAVHAGNPDEMLRACDEVEASGADATGVPAVRHMASVLGRLATLCEPDENRESLWGCCSCRCGRTSSAGFSAKGLHDSQSFAKIGRCSRCWQS